MLRLFAQRLESHVMSCHVMSCHVMSCHVMSCLFAQRSESHGIHAYMLRIGLFAQRSESHCRSKRAPGARSSSCCSPAPCACGTHGWIRAHHAAPHAAAGTWGGQAGEGQGRTCPPVRASCMHRADPPGTSKARLSGSPPMCPRPGQKTTMSSREAPRAPFSMMHLERGIMSKPRPRPMAPVYMAPIWPPYVGLLHSPTLPWPTLPPCSRLVVWVEAVRLPRFPCLGALHATSHKPAMCSECCTACTACTPCTPCTAYTAYTPCT